MGTSQSKRDSGAGRSLVPAWADQDPVAPGSAPANPAAPAQAPPPPSATPPAAGPTPSPSQLTPTGRFKGFRSALGRFAKTGDRREARTALGRWARKSTGGARAGSAKVARAARTGGAALAGLSRASTNQVPAAPNALDIRSLAGMPAEAAIDRIVDAFCPPGILDEDLARMAMGEALVVALDGADTFDPAAINDRAVQVAALTFAAELVFLQVAGDAGQALASAPSPAAAVQRESDLRSLIREVADVVGTPILEAAGNMLAPEAMSGLVSAIVRAVEGEMESW